MFRSRAERKVADAGYDPARLPPGQYLTEKWPVLHAGDVPAYPPDLAGWSFRVFGEVERPLELGWDELDALPKTTVVEDIHCVTRWSRFDAEFRGVPWAAIRERVAPLPSARFAIAHAEAGFTSIIHGKVWHEDITKIGLLAAGTWMMIGNLIMYRLVNFRI